MDGASSSPNVPVVAQGSGSSSDLPAPPSKSWANVVTGTKPSHAQKRMNLKFIQPSMLEGRPQVVIAAKISEAEAKRWASTLVGYFVGGSLPFSAVTNIARSI